MLPKSCLIPAAVPLLILLHGCGGCGEIRLAGDASMDFFVPEDGVELPPAAWAKTYGDIGEDWALSVQETSDSGLIVAGWTAFSVLGVDFWVLKLDRYGTVMWQKAYGGELNDWAMAIRETTDRGFIVAGWTTSYGMGAVDTWVLKLDRDGEIIWQKAYGNSGWNSAFTIEPTSEGGYVVAGETMDPDGLYYSVWIMKLDRDGGIEWQKVYSGMENEAALSIQQTPDNGYIVAKWSAGHSTGDEDFWLLKLDAWGVPEWQKAYGGPEYDYSYAAARTSEGGYVIVGGTESFGMGWSDFWILKLDEGGGVQWQRTYGGEGDDAAYAVEQTDDGGYVVSGWTDSFGGGWSDFWVIKLFPDGRPAWQKTFGAADYEWENRVHQTSDGGYIIAGGTNSYGAGSSDVWVIKMLPDGEIAETCPYEVGMQSIVMMSETSVEGRYVPVSPSDYYTAVTETDAEPVITAAEVETQCSL
ncbi:MAG: hypothetical protein ABIJ56_14230 [Pseudomonadota bacterium]